MKRFAVMLAFWTRIPVRIRSDVTYEDYVAGVRWTPLIALIIGMPLYFVGQLSLWINPYILSLFILFLYVFISGGLHVDGLADTMDAFGSNRDKDRMMDILKDSHIGTFGVLAIVMYGIGMTVLIPNVPIFSLLLFPLVGRLSALLGAKTHEYARESGLGKSFVEGVRVWHIVISVLLYAGIGYLLLDKTDMKNLFIVLMPPAVAILAVWTIVHGMCRKIGGITGDLIGFSIETTSVLYLLFTYIAGVITGVL